MQENTERISRLEGIIEQINERLNHVETGISELRTEIRSNFKWTLGIIITMWATVILTILFKS